MNQFDDILHRASFLHERKYGSDRNATPATDQATLSYYLSHWGKAFADDDQFTKIMDQRGLALATILRGDYQLDLQRREIWGDVLENLNEVADDRLEQLRRKWGFDQLNFSGFLLPFGAVALDLCSEVLDGAALTFKAKLKLVKDIMMNLAAIAQPTLILVLNIQRLSGTLTGETDEARFQYFSTIWLQEHFDEILAQYPVLARQLCTKLVFLTEHYKELAERFQSDLAHIQTLLKVEGEHTPLQITDLDLDMGDSHCSGRSVVILEINFTEKLVYKPRGLGAERLYLAVLEFFNHHLDYPLKAPHVIDQQSYGWIEYAQFRSCESKEDVHNYYWRLGALLCLLRTLKAMDFHYENIIASGEHPILIDLEAILGNDPDVAIDRTARQIAFDELNNSVLKVGLLPTPISIGNNKVVDISGFSGTGGQEFPVKRPSIQKPGTDSMTLASAPVYTAEKQNRVMLRGSAVNPVDYVDNVADGFTALYHQFVRYQEQFLELLDTFSSIDVRQIFRPTSRYASMIGETSHPDHLTNGHNVDLVADRLWSECEKYPYLYQIVMHERQDILQGDVPFFSSQPGKRHLFTSMGKVIHDFFPATVLDQVAQGVRRMSPEDLNKQVGIIRDTLQASILGVEQYSSAASEHLRPETLDDDKQGSVPTDYDADVLKATTAIGRELLETAILGEVDDATWIGMSVVGDEHFHYALGPLETNTYSGTGGVALFLAALYRQTGDKQIYTLLNLAMAPIRRHNRNLEGAEGVSIGVFTGRTSDTYVLYKLSQLLEDPNLLQEAMDGLQELKRHIPYDQSYAFLDGAAGCLYVLLDLYEATRENFILDLAVHCGKRLAEVAERSGGQACWQGVGMPKPLTGISHGTSGIALALSKLAYYADAPRYQQLAGEALAYDRSLFLPRQKNWADLRFATLDEHIDGSFTAPVTWCHGAAGILLARTLHKPYRTDELINEEIELGRVTLSNSLLLKNESLCHGTLGNLDILLRMDAEQHVNKVRRIVSQHLLPRMLQGAWRCGLPRGVKTIGLMLGLAGIGYGLLRTLDPDGVPSVLALD